MNVKEDFIVCIIDVSTISSWAFAQIDSIATLVLLATFALLATTYDHLKVLCILLILSTLGMGTLAFFRNKFPPYQFTDYNLAFRTKLVLGYGLSQFSNDFL